MIDLHSHILYGIDDGSASLEESKTIIKTAIDNGVTDIFLTSHFVVGSNFMADNIIKNAMLENLKNEFKDEINLYLGNEIYINDDILTLLKSNKISFLGSSKYVLIELPVYNEYPLLDEYLFKLQASGLKIIIAHPERYNYFQTDFSKVIALAKRNIYFQGNFMSLYGIYGEKSQKLFKKMIKHQLYSFVGSDIHSSKSTAYKKMNEAQKKIEKLTNKDYAEKIFCKNGLDILENKNIETNIIEKTSFFERLRGNA